MSDHNLKILVVSGEVAPFSKTGGLADVAGSLPKALTLLGNDVRIVTPRYKFIEDTEYVTDFPVAFANRQEGVILRQSRIEAEQKQVPVYFIDNYHYFYRDGIYGYNDEWERYALFCKAVLEMLPRINFQPDIIHCNDWQSGPISMLLKTVYKGNPFYAKIASVYTVHNLLYQGNFDPELMEALGVGREVYNPDGAEFYGTFSYMKAGLVYSDIINTVSKTYAKEIQTAEYGERFEGLLRKRSQDLYGIVNGLDYHEFNPLIDPRIYKNYDKDSLVVKKENKYALQKELRLPQKDVPVIGLVSRLVDQKGLDLIAEISKELLNKEIQFIVLGTGEPRYEDLFENLKSRYPDKMGTFIGFNSILAQRIYAGADFFLMPSRFEPCGLGQLISLRYGTIPIVRTTGGLADTILDYSESSDIGNGFTFAEYKPEHLLDTINRALTVYHQPDKWEKMVHRSMDMDFSWTRSAVEYLEIYQVAFRKVINSKVVA